MAYRLVKFSDSEPVYATGLVRSVKADEGWDFVADTTTDSDKAAKFSEYMNARGFKLRMALDGFTVELVEDDHVICDERGHSGAVRTGRS
jgi:hypothetical protein